jgi:membrane protein YdbS with pleckstrin-like domain
MINKLKDMYIENKDEYRGFLISMFIFNFLVIGIVELTIIHPLDIFKKHKYEYKKNERKVEKNKV